MRVAVHVDLEVGKEAFCIERGHAAHPGGRNRLAINVVGDVARCEYARNFRLG